MTSASTHRARGVAWENEVARYVGGERARVFHPDMGDVTGVHGVVVEAKAQGRFLLQDWIRQLQGQVDTANAQLGLLAVKTKGKLGAAEGLWLIDPRCVPYVVSLVEENWYQDRRNQFGLK